MNYYNLILILLPFTIIVLLIPGNRITILIGDKYIYSIWVFKIALIGKIFILTFSPFYYTIIANRHDDLNLKLSILNSIVNILLCLNMDINLINDIDSPLNRYIDNVKNRLKYVKEASKLEYLNNE